MKSLYQQYFFSFLCSVLFFSLLLFSRIKRIPIKNKKHFYFIPLLNFRNYLFDVMGFSSHIVVYCLWKTLRIIVNFCVYIWCQSSNNTRLYEYLTFFYIWRKRTKLNTYFVKKKMNEKLEKI